jgi:hypothetical protein
MLSPPTPPSKASSQHENVTPSALKVEGNQASIDGVPVHLLGKGVRKKRLVFNFDIYEVMLFGKDPSSFDRDVQGNAALKSLTSMSLFGIRLKLLRDLSGDKIHESFSAALSVNKVSESDAMAAFRRAIKASGGVKKGEHIDLLVNISKGALTLVQGHQIVVIKGDRAFFSQVFSIWLGTPADSGLEDLRNKLIEGSDISKEPPSNV